jgi:hypothetical protein
LGPLGTAVTNRPIISNLMEICSAVLELKHADRLTCSLYMCPLYAHRAKNS